MDDPSGPWPIGDLIGILACLLGSAFFSGSETALTRLPDRKANQLIETDPNRYGVLKFWLDNKRRILADLLVGNNLVNILCSVLGYRVALAFLPDYAEAISVFGLTIIILVFAEVTPKSLAMSHSRHVVVGVLRIVWLLDKVLWVVSKPLSRIPNLIMGRTGQEIEAPTVTEDEIEYQIRWGHDHAVFGEKKQGELLMSAVEFSDTSVKEVMVPRTDMFALEMKTPVTEAVDAIMERGHSRVPVFDERPDDIVGLLYTKDMLGFLSKNPEHDQLTVGKVMRKKLLFVPEVQKISDLLTDMRRRGQHMAIVVDEFGGTAGLVTLEDIIEELVGEIRDEFDNEEVMIRRLGPFNWVVDARMSVHDFKDHTGIEIPDSADYESVGGYVVAEHGFIPQKNATLERNGLRITVLASDARHVERVEIKWTKTVEDTDFPRPAPEPPGDRDVEYRSTEPLTSGSQD